MVDLGSFPKLLSQLMALPSILVRAIPAAILGVTSRRFRAFTPPTDTCGNLYDRHLDYDCFEVGVWGPFWFFRSHRRTIWVPTFSQTWRIGSRRQVIQTRPLVVVLPHTIGAHMPSISSNQSLQGEPNLYSIKYIELGQLLAGYTATGPQVRVYCRSKGSQ